MNDDAAAIADADERLAATLHQLYDRHADTHGTVGEDDAVLTRIAARSPGFRLTRSLSMSMLTMTGIGASEISLTRSAVGILNPSRSCSSRRTASHRSAPDDPRAAASKVRTL